MDLGSSGIRLAVIDAQGQVLAERATAYPSSFDDPGGWRQGLIALVQGLPAQLRQQLGAISLDGTSGTLLACRSDGTPLGPALAYSLACPEQARPSRHWCLPVAPPPVSAAAWPGPCACWASLTGRGCGSRGSR